MAKGFDFDFFTNILEVKTGKSYHFIYDQGYMPLNNDSFILVKKNR
jgi:hypothetical protein